MMDEKPRPTRDELLAAIAQAMRDANTPEAWATVAPNTVPFHHFAEAALLALTGPVEIPAGLDARPVICWTVHCSHCGKSVRDSDYDCLATFPGSGLAEIRNYDVSGFEFDVDGRVLVCEECRVGWCGGCQDEVNRWQPRRVRDDEVWHVDCADEPGCDGTTEGPGPEFEAPGEPSKTPPVMTDAELDATVRRANEGIAAALEAVVDTEAGLVAVKQRGANR